MTCRPPAIAIAALAGLWLCAPPAACAAPATASLAVSLLQSDGDAMQLRLRMAGQAPILDSDSMPGRLLLRFPGPVVLARPIPVLPAGETGPLQGVSLDNADATARLELALARPVHPSLRRVGDSWVLRLDPATPALAAPAPPQVKSRRTGRRGAALAANPVEMLLVEMTVNTQRLDGVIRVEQPEGQSLLVPVEAWQQARLAPLPKTQPLGDGTPAYALDAVSGLSYRLDRQGMTLDVSAPASAFVGSAAAFRNKQALLPPRPDPGILLNYDMSVSRSPGGQHFVGATGEAVAFGPFGSIVTSGLVRDDGRQRNAERLDTYWRYDMPQHLQTLTVGDAVGSAGGWSRSARFGGIRWARDFGLQPQFVVLPQLTMSGEAALPSTVDVMVNNTRRLSQSMPPGPFELTNIPVITGAGEVNLVVRDLLGRETVIRQNYYMSPQLLAPGLTDFSLEAGRLRTGYGQASQYGDPFGVGTLRAGLTRQLTGELRIEVERERRAAGIDMVAVLGGSVIGHVAAAISRGGADGPLESGHLLRLGLERMTPRGGGAVRYEYNSRNFSPFAESGPAAAQCLRERWIANLGGPIAGRVTGSVNYLQQTMWHGDALRSLGLGASMPLWKSSNLMLTANKRLDGERGWRAGAGLSLPIAGGVQRSMRLESQPGQTDATVAASRAAPAGPGWGWGAQASTVESRRVRADLQYNTNDAEWVMEAASDADGGVSARGGGRGSVGWMAGQPFASRPIGNSSFAIVDVNGVPGLPVKRSHQVVAVTDANGRAFLPGLMPWQYNQIEIDPSDLPLDTEVRQAMQEVLPFARSGTVIRFDVRRTRQAALVLHQPDGKPVPPGARVRLLPDGPESVVGRRGQAWLTDLKDEEQRVQVSWAGGGCVLALQLPATKDATPAHIGPLSCGSK